jgi:peptide/nickel transport system permease protein
MYRFIVRRLIWMIPSFFAVSLVSFIIMRLPPGDFVTSYAADLATSGAPADQATLDNLRHHYGLDRPLYVQYVSWIQNALEGDLGVSFEYRAPVADIIWSRLGMTFRGSKFTLDFVRGGAFPIVSDAGLRE